MNKKGEEAINFIPFLFLIVVVTGAIVAGVLAFFGSGYDPRASEAESLYRAVSNCVLEQGELIFKEGFEICGFNEEVLAEEHLVLVEYLENRKLIGVFDYSNQCYLNGDDLPVCIDGEVKGFRILVGTNQRGERI